MSGTSHSVSLDIRSAGDDWTFSLCSSEEPNLNLTRSGTKRFNGDAKRLQLFALHFAVKLLVHHVVRTNPSISLTVTFEHTGAAIYLRNLLTSPLSELSTSQRDLRDSLACCVGVAVTQPSKPCFIAADVAEDLSLAAFAIRFPFRASHHVETVLAVPSDVGMHTEALVVACQRTKELFENVTLVLPNDAEVSAVKSVIADRTILGFDNVPIRSIRAGQTNDLIEVQNLARLALDGTL